MYLCSTKTREVLGDLWGGWDVFFTSQILVETSKLDMYMSKYKYRSTTIVLSSFQISCTHQLSTSDHLTFITSELSQVSSVVQSWPRGEELSISGWLTLLGHRSKLFSPDPPNLFQLFFAQIQLNRWGHPDHEKYVMV